MDKGPASDMVESCHSTGPRSADGGFRIKILMRENGKVSDKALKVEGDARNGYIRLFVELPGKARQMIFYVPR